MTYNFFTYPVKALGAFFNRLKPSKKAERIYANYTEYTKANLHKVKRASAEEIANYYATHKSY